MIARRALIIGRTGQLARKLADAATAQEWQVECLDRSQIDLAETDQIHAKLKAALEQRPGLTCVINTAAYTAVDRAESERDLAYQINAEAPGEIARTCALFDIPLIHISTDFVFDGNARSPYGEDAACSPRNVYGASKHAGEAAIIAARGRHIILRTAWLFSEYPGNFLTTMLRLGGEHDRLKVVDDQIGGPTPSDALADAIFSLAIQLDKGASAPQGLYHFAGETAMSWAGFARAIFAEAGINCEVEAITAKAFGAAAERPAYSVLDTSKLQAETGIGPADFKAGLARAIARAKA